MNEQLQIEIEIEIVLKISVYQNVWKSSEEYFFRNKMIAINPEQKVLMWNSHVIMWNCDIVSKPCLWSIRCANLPFLYYSINFQ